MTPELKRLAIELMDSLGRILGASISGTNEMLLVKSGLFRSGAYKDSRGYVAMVFWEGSLQELLEFKSEKKG